MISRFKGTAPTGMTFASGQIYYTTDGSDPRASNGSPQGTLYTAAIRVRQTQTISARLYDGTTWSPLAKAIYVVGAVAPTSTNLVVNEIMYHAGAPTFGEESLGYRGDGDFDWLEVLNVGTAPVDLSSLRFKSGIVFDFSSLPAASRVLAPNQAGVLVSHREAFTARYGGSAAARILGEYQGTLSNAGEILTLGTASGGVISSFEYKDGASWPAADGTNLTLEQVNPSARANLNLFTSWRASSAAGGTPGVR